MRRGFMVALVAGLALAPLQTALAIGDAAAGHTVFHAKCGVCHSVVQGQNRVGPSLFGVVGRKAGSVAGYNYSAANKSSGKTWDEATLDVYLTNPKLAVPGTKMTFAGLPDATDRGNLIAYLSTVK